MAVKLIFYKQIECPKILGITYHHKPLQIIFEKLAFYVKGSKILAVKKLYPVTINCIISSSLRLTVTINNWDDVKQGINILFDEYINMDIDREVCGNLSGSHILVSVTNTSYVRQSSDEEKEQE